jgi:hypothetical protein
MAVESPLKPAPLSASIVHHTDPFLPIDRAARALERNIQAFLDAQSEGLSAGLGSGAQDDFSSNGSLTPTPSTSTLQSLTRPKIIPIRQPQKKRISLTGARKGLAKSIKEFVLVKQEEIKVLNEEEARREQALRSVDHFETKRAGLKDQIAKIQNEAGARHVNNLKAEAENLESEIKRLEDELAEKRARHRHLINQVHQTENSVQSKLSSFEASLKMLDSEIKTFLKSPPIEQSLQAGERHTMSAGDFYSLNPKRRTLDLAKDHWIGERAILRDRKQDVAAEIAALKAGSDIWRRIVTEISDFEKWLQKETREFSTSQPASPVGMSSALVRMDGLIDLLEQQYHFAEENGWNLLLCCIGAELEAFREGKALLLQTLGLVQENGDGSSQGTLESELIEYRGANENGRGLSGSNESLRATLLAMDGTNDEPPHEIISLGPGVDSRSESEDEGPGPDFLISHE